MAREPEVVSDSPRQNRRVTEQRDAEQRAAYSDDYSGFDTPVSRESIAPATRLVRSRGQTARTVVGLMAFTTFFALVSTEIEAVGGHKTGTNGVRIILGGGVATVVLLLVNEAGDAGAQLAEGLAVVALVGTVLVRGKPVWDWLGKVVGPGNETAPTSTGGVSQVIASSGPPPGVPPGAVVNIGRGGTQ